MLHSFAVVGMHGTVLSHVTARNFSEALVEARSLWGEHVQVARIVD